ncbi:MAG: helix-turn-helix, type 11 protein [uncultured bacterium]|nr:MAG: helix-turn-helix, type 11 protein [uncultured bacterium]
MNIKQLILAQFDNQEQVTNTEIVQKTGKTRAWVNLAFRELVEEGKIVRLGKTKGAFYVLANKESVKEAKSQIIKFRRVYKNIDLKEDNVLKDIKHETGIFLNIPNNILHILEYSFTEMLNNAIDHSQSEKINVEISRTATDISFSIDDRGVGIFNNIKEKKNLPDVMVAIGNLLKGKTTTDPDRHTGEGIFFTSRIADVFIVNSFGKKLFFHNILEDIFVEDVKSFSGTQVFFIISLVSIKDLKSLFDKYTDTATETYAFNTSEVIVKLFQFGDNMISRSQAKRVLEGMEKFENVTLDFKDVHTIGQGFADEVFRVWQNEYPNIKIDYRHANENITFMLKRAKGEV